MLFRLWVFRVIKKHAAAGTHALAEDSIIISSLVWPSPAFSDVSPQLASLAVGATSLTGPLPQAWGNMTSLQVLDIGDACGICGNLPAFPQAATGRPQVQSSGSSLGWNCTRGQCGGGFPISIVAQAGAQKSWLCIAPVCWLAMSPSGYAVRCLLRPTYSACLA